METIKQDVINLDPTFTPYGPGAEFDRVTFPSGVELNIKFNQVAFNPNILITTRIKSSDDLVFLLLATDAIRRTGGKYIKLFIPYFPYARQDRQMTFGESLSVKVIADIINSQNYYEVGIFDPHSDVTPALLKNVVIFKNHVFVKEVLKDKKDYLIVCPDAGAYKKVYDVCKFIDYKDQIVICNKVRDVSNGRILDTTINVEDLKGKDCYIIDDICSKGGTFMAIAEKLKAKNSGNIYLVVSHYEGVADEKMLSERISGVYTTNSMNDYQTDFVKQIKF